MQVERQQAGFVRPAFEQGAPLLAEGAIIERRGLSWSVVRLFNRAGYHFSRDLPQNALDQRAAEDPELSDAQVCKLLGTTKPTIAAVRDRTHWNSANIRPRDPVILGLCRQVDLDDAIAKARAAGRKRAPEPVAEAPVEKEQRPSNIPDWMVGMTLTRGGGGNR